ncbi:YhfX family PLP-dependent enzyme [Geosporobacter ferrireducens]|uniref:Amino-acid racemase n=1 Tax=Geosporobacter ferrireducens TaxID=1424294 RepID=A0A1D8GHI2_9FIRM|nr:YhfX family PLP-dependent enzyme [Geosporobacter ferrireducens]AOT70357.1 amino-acid racemase [Geosporobacter ferrireducens]MTI54330.1 YhfX family PLP-dependent enzyme [Geosporobacter ferrireducens]
MFLDMTIKRNPKLIETAIKFHREGLINPNSYVLDIDEIKSNAQKLSQAAKKHNITLYMMTKQIGRNAEIAKIIAESGIAKAVAVDPWEAIELGRAGIKLGHVGHLVQIPFGMIREVLSYKPEVITVFSVEKAREISEEALRLEMRQDILLKVVGPNDLVCEGQVGGFKEEELIEKAKEIKKLQGVTITGVTAFPCFLYDSEKGKIKETENVYTVIRSVKKLKEELGIEIKQINTPSANAVASFPLLAKLGATHGEPGHALTGTTPIHENEIVEEKPAMVYVSEISHCFEDKAYVYGGGYYRRSRVKKAMVGRDFENMRQNILEAEEISPEAIDYYGILKLGERAVHIGDTVIYAFRTQIFVTRSEVVLVKGIQSNHPEIIGVYDSLGKKLR